MTRTVRRLFPWVLVLGAKSSLGCAPATPDDVEREHVVHNRGQLAEIDCSNDGGTCGLDGATGNNCLYDTDTTASPCGDLTFEGECQGNEVVWCDGTPQQLDCSLSGSTCGFNDQAGYYDCL